MNSASSGGHLPPPRVAIIDDHEILRQGLRLCLEQEGSALVVFDAATTEEAYRLIPTTTPEVIILDLAMPTESGLSALRRIREQWPRIRLIVFTGSTDDGHVVQALLAGADGVVRKVHSGREIVRAIASVVGGKSYLCPEAADALIKAYRECYTCAVKATPPCLSAREAVVLRQIAEGRSYKEIADDLGISAKSVETYRARISEKTGCGSRADLVRYAVRAGVVAL